MRFLIVWALPFLIGHCAVQHIPTLPNLSAVIIASLGACVMALLLIFIYTQSISSGDETSAKANLTSLLKTKNKKTRLLCNNLPIQEIIYIIIAFTLGFVWMWWHAYHHLTKALPEAAEGKTLTIVGTVVSLPEKLHSSSLRFEFDIKNTLPQHDWPNPGRVRLYFDENQGPFTASVSNPLSDIQVGDTWEFNVKLKRPFGYATPGSFDKEKYFFQNRWHAEGSIISTIKTPTPPILHKPGESSTPNKTNTLTISNNKKIASHFWSKPIDRLRGYLLQKMRKGLGTSQYGEIIIALVLGIREGIQIKQWEVFRNTGTAHLMAISGLHIGFMAGFVYFLMKVFWRRLPLPLPFKNIPATLFASRWAIAAAIVYSLLAGFSVSTQRALVMVLLFMVHILFRLRGNAWQNYAIALWAVLIMDPFASLNAGFWLSFGAVGVILYAMQNRLNPQGVWWKWGRTQWVVFIGLTPLSIIFFQQVSLVSPVVNSIAIPWVSFAVVPFALLGALILPFVEPLGQGLLMVAEKAFAFFWPVLEWAATRPHSYWQSSGFSTLSFILALIGILIALAPRGLPRRSFGLIFILPIILNKPPPPPFGSLRFFLLDVGQGLAAVIQTAQHNLLFDAGPNLSIRGMGIDTGERVILPFLATQGIETIDSIVISHGDNDHSGGLSAIVKKIKVKSVLTSEVDFVRSMINPTIQKTFNQSTNTNTGTNNGTNTNINTTLNAKTFQPPTQFPIQVCYAGQHWSWDGVKFEMLHPETLDTRKRNDHSCVLKVTTGNKSILLTGDIEARSEMKILERNQTHKTSSPSKYCIDSENVSGQRTHSFNHSLSANILVVPHHGSRTSSSLEFIQAVNPEYALIPVGYRNAYGHPKVDIVKRYQALGVNVLDTVHSGAISFFLSDDEKETLEKPEEYRMKYRKFWHRAKVSSLES